jgi:hypothetical protein
MSAIDFASWFIRNHIDLSSDTIDSILSRLDSSWVDFSNANTALEFINTSDNDNDNDNNNDNTDSYLLDAFQRISLEDDNLPSIVPTKITPKPRVKKDKPVTELTSDSDAIVPTKITPKPRVKKDKPVTELPPVTELSQDVEQPVTELSQDVKQPVVELSQDVEQPVVDAIVPTKKTPKPRVKKDKPVAELPLDTDIPVPTKKTPKPRVNKNKLAEPDNNIIIVSSHHTSSPQEPEPQPQPQPEEEQQEEEEDDLLTEIFVNDVLFYFHQTHNTWFDSTLSPVSDPTL